MQRDYKVSSGHAKAKSSRRSYQHTKGNDAVGSRSHLLDTTNLQPAKKKGSPIVEKILNHKLYNTNTVYYKVSELSKLTGISRQQIHIYTQLGLIKEAYRSKSGHRFYSYDTVDRIFLIEMLKRHRTLAEVKQYLSRKDKK